MQQLPRSNNESPLQRTALSLARRLTCAAGRAYPCYRGRHFFAQSPLPMRLAPKVGPIDSTLRGGASIRLMADDWVGRMIYYTGDFDPSVSWLCRRILRPGDTMLDVGANFGVISLMAAKLVGPTGFVHAFEPQTELADLIAESAQANRFENLRVHRVALSDRAGLLPLAVPTWNRGMASLSRSRASSAMGRTVKVDRADHLLGAESERRIRLVKIDVEGHELEVLRGMSRIMSHRPPQVVEFESNESEIGLTLSQREPVQLLREWNYAIYRLVREWNRVRVVRVKKRDPFRGEAELVALQSNQETHTVLQALEA